jgi:hypothetical protein
MKIPYGLKPPHSVWPWVTRLDESGEYADPSTFVPTVQVGFRVHVPFSDLTEYGEPALVTDLGWHRAPTLGVEGFTGNVIMVPELGYVADKPGNVVVSDDQGRRIGEVPLEGVVPYQMMYAWEGIEYLSYYEVQLLGVRWAVGPGGASSADDKNFDIFDVTYRVLPHGEFLEDKGAGVVEKVILGDMEDNEVRLDELPTVTAESAVYDIVAYEWDPDPDDYN